MVEVPVEVSRVVRLTWVLVGLAAVMVVLAVVLDDEILRAAGWSGSNPDDTRVPPSYTPVVVVLFVVVSSLELVLLAFVRGAHNWARHCLAASFVLLAVSMAALLRTGPPVAFVPLVVVWIALAVLLLHQLYRPATSAFMTPHVEVPVAGA